MKKHEFLQHLDAELTGFDQEERAQFLRYCDEMIEDRIEEGMSEEEAVGSEADIDALLESFRAHAKPDMHTAMDGTMKTWVADARNIRDIRVFVENNRLNLRESSGSSICVHYPEDSNYLISRSCEDGKFFFEMREKEKPSFTGLWFKSVDSATSLQSISTRNATVGPGFSKSISATHPVKPPLIAEMRSSLPHSSIALFSLLAR